jgi:hypothetical protein
MWAVAPKEKKIDFLLVVLGLLLSVTVVRLMAIILIQNAVYTINFLPLCSFNSLIFGVGSCLDVLSVLMDL